METILAALIDHWIEALVGLIFMGIGWWIGRWRSKKAFRKREFYERINISLNSIVDDKLLIRTLSEKPSQEVFLNTVAVSKLLDAAMKTTTEDPIIPLDSDDHWFYLNSILNELSEQFSVGFIAREAGHKPVPTQFVVCLTNECDGNLRTRKIRAMVIRKDLLENLPQSCPTLEQGHHGTRWKTLKTMAKRWEENPIQFMEVELLS